jgi:hypothetical protein
VDSDDLGHHPPLFRLQVSGIRFQVMGYT